MNPTNSAYGIIKYGIKDEKKLQEQLAPKNHPESEEFPALPPLNIEIIVSLTENTRRALDEAGLEDGEITLHTLYQSICSWGKFRDSKQDEMTFRYLTDPLLFQINGRIPDYVVIKRE